MSKEEREEVLRCISTVGALGMELGYSKEKIKSLIEWICGIGEQPEFLKKIIQDCVDKAIDEASTGLN